MADAILPPHALVMQFVAALLQRTLGCPTVEAHQHALQGFLDDLTPWISPADLPTLLEQPFTLFDHLAFTPMAMATTRTSRWRCPRAGRSCSAPGCASGAGPAGVQLVRSGPCLGHLRRTPPASARAPHG